MTPGLGQFLPKNRNLNKLGEVPPGDAAYLLSRLEALWFQTMDFLKMCSLYEYDFLLLATET